MCVVINKEGHDLNCLSLSCVFAREISAKVNSKSELLEKSVGSQIVPGGCDLYPTGGGREVL